MKNVNPIKCKNCHRGFERLRKHLVQSATCKLLYSDEEFEAIAKLKKSDQNIRFRNNNKKKKVLHNSTTCKSCNKGFERITKHLSEKPTCKQLYSKEEIKAITNMKKSAKNKRFHVKNKWKNKKEKAEYNYSYYLANRNELVQKKKAYNKKNQATKAKKQKVYQNVYINKNNRPTCQRQRHLDVPGNSFYIHSVNKGFDWSKEDWCDVAGKELLQDQPNYIKWIVPNTWRVVMYMDPEQLLDTINHYKKKGHPEYKEVYIDYGFMSHTYENQPEDNQNSGSDHKPTSKPQYSQINIQKLSPQYSDVGLSNTVILAGKIFNGEEVKEDTNVITKLRTHSRQHYPEKEDGSSWCLDPDHLIHVLKFWKKKNHVCLRGIRFPDILDLEKNHH